MSERDQLPLTWLFNHTAGSVLMAWIFYVSIKMTNSLFFAGDQVAQWLLAGLGFTTVAAAVFLVEGPERVVRVR